MQLLLSLLNNHYLDLKVFSSSFCICSIAPKRRGSEWLSVWLLTKANPPHHVLLLESASETSGHICSRNSSAVWFFYFLPMCGSSMIQWSSPYLLLSLWSKFLGACRCPWINIWNPDIIEFWNNISSNIFKHQLYVLPISRKSLIATAESLSVGWSALYFWLKMRLNILDIVTTCNNKKGKF